MITLQQITNYVSENITDPVQKYIFIKEIQKAEPSTPEYISAYNDMTQTKWYRELADEQNEDGSWGEYKKSGRRAEIKIKFIYTGVALRRARELSLSKDDPMIAKCITILEKYLTGEAEIPGRIEVHQDGGKGNRIWRGFGPAMDLNMLDPHNPLVKPLQESMTEILKVAFESGLFNEDYFNEVEENYRIYIIGHPRISGGLMVMQKAECMDESLQRHYLNYVWGNTAAMELTRDYSKYKGIRKWPDEIGYMAGFLPINKKSLEEKDFITWLSLLELLSGFSLFGEFMKDDALPHLLNEADRLINSDVALPNPFSGHVKDCGNETNGRYAENWRNKNKRKTDMILRIARIIVKC